MYIPYWSFHQCHIIKYYVWGELKHYVRFNRERENFTKLKTRFFLRLRNRGRRKYVLNKLFRSVTFAQRNKLLKLEPSPVHYWQPLTFQQAERTISMGEDHFCQSQEEEATSEMGHLDKTLEATGHQMGIILPKGIPHLLT